MSNVKKGICLGVARITSKKTGKEYFVYAIVDYDHKDCFKCFEEVPEAVPLHEGDECDYVVCAGKYFLIH